MNMLCLKCKNEQFTEKTVDVPQTFRGEEFKVRASAMVCTECGWFTMTDAQADKLCVLTADEYRRNHGLLTTAEIIACRNARHMSQRKFASFLGVGEASVKRWETGTVQEPLYDDRIRQKCGSMRGQKAWEDAAIRQGHASRFTTFTAVNATKFASRKGMVTFSTAAKRAQFKVQLSDGHPWRAEHLNPNDPDLCPTA